MRSGSRRRSWTAGCEASMSSPRTSTAPASISPWSTGSLPPRPAAQVGSPQAEADDYGLTIDVAPMAGDEKLRLEKELLGLYLSDHPLRRISVELARLSDTQAVEVTSALQDTEVRVA